ncbi:MAG: class I SAM-dependent methyltransferase, partial [Chloroflexi bacterium]
MTDDTERLNQIVRDEWRQKATFWDEKMGDDGNLFHRVIVGPSVELLLDVQAGEVVLDVACGSGVFSRRLIDLGVEVVACDFSEPFIECARVRKHGDRIDFHIIDATDEAALLTLGEGRFDAVVCNMALMDMATIDPLLRAVTRLLKPSGRFVFSIPHPSFNSNATVMVREAGDSNGQLYEHHSIKVMDYLDVAPGRGAGMTDEPNPHHYFHRPLSALLNACFDAGLVLDRLDEPIP